MADTLYTQQASIGGEAELAELFKVVQPSADIEVVSVVDDRLGAKCPTLMVVLDTGAEGQDNAPPNTIFPGQ